MSFRLLTSRLVKHGRYFLQTYYKRDFFTNILEQTNTTRRRIPINAVRAVQTATSNISQLTTTKAQPSGIFRFGQHARKLFIDNILSRVTSTYSQELCNKATKKLFYGDSAPFFALVGVSLASGAGVLTKEDELEGVCYEIREAAVRLQNSWNDEEISNTIDNNFNIDKLNIGPAIAKGCAAVVYAASFKTDMNSSTILDPHTQVELSKKIENIENQSHATAMAMPLQSPTNVMTPIQNISRFVHNFGGSVDNLHAYMQTSLSAAFTQEFTQRNGKEDDKSESVRRMSSSQSVGFSGISSGMQGMQKLDTSNADIQRYPLALKMMFNYDIQSNALSILRAMYKETVPARYRAMNTSSEDWEQLIHDQTTPLPPHPNIVLMFGYFCGQVGNFPDGHILYPIAQPPRINPHGYGRNMSLYLLMKRYDQSLRNLLDTCQLSPRAKLLLFTQLLEGIVHINRHGVAHRDLKTDNILIEQSRNDACDADSTPILVLSDFGCCLADKNHGLKIPYTSHDIDKGGNAALMAPEIINKQPGPFSVLNYSKADLWACGAIAYEIFGLKNPFYSTTNGAGVAAGDEQTFSLRNNNYKQDDLPELTYDCPILVQELIYNILNPNPSKRVSPDIAANVMQLFLWAPSNWLKAGGMPSSPEVLQWLLSLSTKIQCEGRKSNRETGANFISYNRTGRRTYVEYLLICSFLARARLRRIRGALSWIQGVVV